MKDYANLMMQNKDPPIFDQSETAIARIVQNLDGTQRLVPSSTADPTSSAFQLLLGPQGSLTTALGIQGVAPSPAPATTITPATTLTPSVTTLTPSVTTLTSSLANGCPTGATGCNPDPFFHFPDLEKDTANCLYIPTFTDVPITLSMAVYFVQAFLKEVNTDTLLSEINKEVKTIVDKVVHGNLVYNYLPMAILLILIVWVLVIHGTLNWKTGVFLTAIVITVFWLGFLLLDAATRGISGDVLSKTKNKAVETFGEKNGAIICNLLKGYYAGVSHMILPEAAICSSPTGLSFNPCNCIDTGLDVGPVSLKLPSPAIIINNQIRLGGEERCNGINNDNTLLPIIEAACPCIKDIDGFTLSKLSKEKKEDLLDCVLNTLPTSLTTGTGCSSKGHCLVKNCMDKEIGLKNLEICGFVDSAVICQL